MPDRIHCRVAHVTAREDRRDALEDLIYKMFERRHHDFVGGREQDWLTVELVQSLRRKSEVYREALSTKTSGPLPFALGYFRLNGETVRLTTDEIPANVAPEVLVRLLSEFVEPGAQFWFGRAPEAEGWEVEGIDDLAPVSPAE
jgi:hypothetical protein